MAKRRPKKKVAKATGGNPWPRRLAEFREQYDLSQADAAALVPVTSRSWISWENGDRRPLPIHARALAALIESHGKKKRKK